MVSVTIAPALRELTLSHNDQEGLTKFQTDYFGSGIYEGCSGKYKESTYERHNKQITGEILMLRGRMTMSQHQGQPSLQDRLVEEDPEINYPTLYLSNQTERTRRERRTIMVQKFKSDECWCYLTCGYSRNSIVSTTSASTGTSLIPLLNATAYCHI